MNPISWFPIFLLTGTLYAQTAEVAQPTPGLRLPDRTHAVLGELAWNGLTGGLGVMYSHYFPGSPSVVDLGVGFGVTGGRFGARYRYLFVPEKRTSPFLGAGLNYATGLGQSDFNVEDSNKDTLVVHIHDSFNLLINLGLDLKAHNGFVFIPSIGWDFDLKDNDYNVVSGVENPNHRQELRLLLKGGFQLSFILGWSF